MDTIKNFLARDVVKVILGAVFTLASGLVILYVKDPELQKVALAALASTAGWLGIVSGGTSGLRSDESNAVTTALKTKGVVPPGV